MTENEDTRGTQARAEARIAQAQAARAPVDSQGRPTSKPTTYIYDRSGKLVSATPGEAEDPVRYTYDGHGQVTGHTGGAA